MGSILTSLMELIFDSLIFPNSLSVICFPDNKIIFPSLSFISLAVYFPIISSFKTSKFCKPFSLSLLAIKKFNFSPLFKNFFFVLESTRAQFLMRFFSFFN